MFSFFRKKHFIADYLEGLTDMHCHILPGIDDGSEDNEMSLTMLNQFIDLGYTGIIATPHIMEGMYQNSSSKILRELKTFRKLIAENGFQGFSVDASAEYMLDQGFDNLLVNRDFLPITGKKILVEMSYFQQNIYVESQIFDLQQHGFEPILAHPERYPYLRQTEDVIMFQRKGCYLQLNILALSGHYGPAVYKRSIDLLAKNHYDFIGTDAHKPAHLEKLKEITISKKLIAPIEALVNTTKENMSN